MNKSGCFRIVEDYCGSGWFIRQLSFEKQRVADISDSWEMIDTKCIEDFVRIALRLLNWPKLVQPQEGVGVGGRGWWKIFYLKFIPNLSYIIELDLY